MEKYFDGEDASPNDEENAEMPQEETITKVKPKSRTHTSPTRKMVVKKSTRKRKR